MKVPRSNGESSKGACWALHPQLIEYLKKEANGQCHREEGKGRKLKRASSYNGKDARQPRGGGGRKRVKSEAQTPVDPCGLPGDLDWISLLSSQRVSCGSYGSPILGPPDLGQVGDPMICSPLIVPTSITTASPSAPATSDPALETVLKDEKTEDEEVFRSHHNSCGLPSPHLLPWEDSRPLSPSPHPWAESRETTLSSLGRDRQTIRLPPINRTSNPIWSPDTPCYSSSSSCLTSTSFSRSYSKSRTPAESYIY